jgi:hypothetical protein
MIVIDGWLAFPSSEKSLSSIDAVALADAQGRRLKFRRGRSGTEKLQGWVIIGITPWRGAGKRSRRFSVIRLLALMHTNGKRSFIGVIYIDCF